MEVRAISRSVRMSPRKVRLVADAIRALSIDEAFQLLEVTPKRSARIIAKTLQSAVANATNNAKLDKSNLVIASIMVNEAPALKRFHPSSRGRAHPYKKRGSHLSIVVKEKARVVPLVKSEVVETKSASAKATARQEEAKK